MSEVKVEDLDKLILEISAYEQEIDVVELDLKERNKTLQNLKNKATGYLKDLGRSSYSAPNGSVAINEVWNIKMPSTPEDKALLFDWMKERGIYESLATVHAVTLKSLFMKEREAALQSGEGDPVTFSLPGMAPATCYEMLKFTKKRN